MTWVVALESVTQWLGEAALVIRVKMMKGGQEPWGLCAAGDQWGNGVFTFVWGSLWIQIASREQRWVKALVLVLHNLITKG